MFGEEQVMVESRLKTLVSKHYNFYFTLFFKDGTFSEAIDKSRTEHNFS